MGNICSREEEFQRGDPLNPRRSMDMISVADSENERINGTLREPFHSGLPTGPKSPPTRRIGVHNISDPTAHPFLRPRHFSEMFNDSCKAKQFLADKGHSIKHAVLHRAVDDCNIQSLLNTLKSSTEVDPVCIDVPDKDGNTCLHKAAWKGDAEICNILLKVNRLIPERSESLERPHRPMISSRQHFAVGPCGALWGLAHFDCSNPREYEYINVREREAKGAREEGGKEGGGREGGRKRGKGTRVVLRG